MQESEDQGGFNLLLYGFRDLSALFMQIRVAFVVLRPSQTNLFFIPANVRAQSGTFIRIGET